MRDLETSHQQILTHCLEQLSPFEQKDFTGEDLRVLYNQLIQDFVDQQTIISTQQRNLFTLFSINKTATHVGQDAFSILQKHIFAPQGYTKKQLWQRKTHFDPSNDREEINTANYPNMKEKDALYLALSIEETQGTYTRANLLEINKQEKILQKEIKTEKNRIKSEADTERYNIEKQRPWFSWQIYFLFNFRRLSAKLNLFRDEYYIQKQLEKEKPAPPKNTLRPVSFSQQLWIRLQQSLGYPVPEEPVAPPEPPLPDFTIDHRSPAQRRSDYTPAEPSTKAAAAAPPLPHQPSFSTENPASIYLPSDITFFLSYFLSFLAEYPSSSMAAAYPCMSTVACILPSILLASSALTAPVMVAHSPLLKQLSPFLKKVTHGFSTALTLDNRIMSTQHFEKIIFTMDNYWLKFSTGHGYYDRIPPRVFEALLMTGAYAPKLIYLAGESLYKNLSGVDDGTLTRFAEEQLCGGKLDTNLTSDNIRETIVWAFQNAAYISLAMAIGYGADSIPSTLPFGAMITGAMRILDTIDNPTIATATMETAPEEMGGALKVIVELKTAMSFTQSSVDNRPFTRDSHYLEDLAIIAYFSNLKTATPEGFFKETEKEDFKTKRATLEQMIQEKPRIKDLLGEDFLYSCGVRALAPTPKIIKFAYNIGKKLISSLSVLIIGTLAAPFILVYLLIYGANVLPENNRKQRFFFKQGLTLCLILIQIYLILFYFPKFYFQALYGTITRVLVGLVLILGTLLITPIGFIERLYLHGLVAALNYALLQALKILLPVVRIMEALVKLAVIATVVLLAYAVTMVALFQIVHKRLGLIPALLSALLTPLTLVLDGLFVAGAWIANKSGVIPNAVGGHYLADLPGFFKAAYQQKSLLSSCSKKVDEKILRLNHSDPINQAIHPKVRAVSRILEDHLDKLTYTLSNKANAFKYTIGKVLFLARMPMRAMLRSLQLIHQEELKEALEASEKSARNHRKAFDENDAPIQSLDFRHLSSTATPDNKRASIAPRYASPPSNNCERDPAAGVFTPT